ncbi:MAG: hypothetical protein A2Y91_05265 [Chloroflexi bacterium RBG_13_54_8]|nr:MAG: hypothetical protein A2Y91_05265 [Chloroflexi bacterium RBG_13_54_8]
MPESLEQHGIPNYQKYVPFGARYYNLWMLVHLTSSAIMQARRRETGEVGLRYQEFALLRVVDELHGSATPAEISRWLRRKPQSISGLLTRMEKRGLARRKRSKENKKLKIVVILPKGREALDQAMKNDSIRTIMELPEEEFRQLWWLLEKLKDRALSWSKSKLEAEPGKE